MRKLLFILVVLFLAACGNDSGSSDPQPVPPPKAVATLNFAVAAGETVILDGSQSTPGVEPTTYTWTVTDADGNVIPVNSPAPALPGMAFAAAAADPSDPIATFEAPVGAYTAILTVTDATEQTSSAEGGVLVYDYYGPTVGVLVMYTATTMESWLVNATLEDVPIMIQNGYPWLQEGWDNGTVRAVVLQVPNADIFNSNFFYVEDFEVKMRVM